MADENTIYPVLFLTADGRDRTLTAALARQAATDTNAATLLRDRLSPRAVDAPAKTVDDARERLRTGFAGVGGHRFLIVGGDMASRMTRADLDEMTRVAVAGYRLIAFGLSASDAERAALIKLGLVHILSLPEAEQSVLATWNAFAWASVEFKSRATDRARAMNAAVEKVQVHVDSAQGCLARGIIVVHASKGGVGKTMTAASLAWGLARGGGKVLLVDFNPHGAGTHVYFRDWIIGKHGSYESWDEFFDTKGLGPLSHRVSHSSSTKLTLDDITACVETILDGSKGATGAMLDFLPGIRDQSPMQGGQSSGGRQTAEFALLNNSRWINDFIEATRSMDRGYTYVVLDMGIDWTDAPGRDMRIKGDLLVWVLDASSNAIVEWEAEQTEHHILGLMAERRTLGGGKMLVANKLQPAGTAYAPSVKNVRDIFGEHDGDGEIRFIDVLGVEEDGAALRAALGKGVPVLALEPKDTGGVVTPAQRDLMALVNKVHYVYDLGAGKPAGGEKRGLFGLRR
jgi:MinD-like ATPase involved in chromosome partitioning or flagellar assembly